MAYKVLVHEGEEITWHPRHKWDSNVKMVCKEMGFDDVNQINLAHERSNGWLM
jgi:hypothetical protein